MAGGTLFTEDFLAEGIKTSPAWASLPDTALAKLRADMAAIFERGANPGQLNEAQTQNRIIEPILHLLGWKHCYSVQTNIERKNRTNVSDYAFFGEEAAFTAADAEGGFDRKLCHAVAVGDAKKWAIGLDEGGKGAGAGESPAAQILRYLIRAETVSERAVRWGILTNGRHWRIYYSGARSLLDGYFEADLAWIFGLAGTQGQLAPPTAVKEGDAERRDRLLRIFVLVFQRDSFAKSADLGGKTFHEYAVDAGRLWETKVRTDLSGVVFQDVFPGLIRAIAKADRSAPRPYNAAYLESLREAALTVLYRLLFALYAEDRDLLPARDSKFDDYALSTIRDDIAARLDKSDAFSTRVSRYWQHCGDLFRIVDEGDESLGIPPYNGGLFAAERAPILQSVSLPDADFAPLLDQLSRTRKDGRLVRINFRDLSVRELGAIYEGLLEFEPVAEADKPGGIDIRPNLYSRKNTGSYYTPDELVTLIIERAVGPMIEERVERFRAAARNLASDHRPKLQRLAELEALDPATRILDLKVCDPAMGSGHFLVSLIDYLAANVLRAMGDAGEQVDWAEYRSPLLQRIDDIRKRIRKEAAAHKWTVRDEQLNDQNLVKRMVLKRCVYGVDKNPMAVELAKVALWLHTFTVGAPLSFLDHHLRCGDSLFGERVRGALDALAKRGTLLINDAVAKAQSGIAGMQLVESLTDAELAEVRRSGEAFAGVEDRTRPLARFLDFWQALKWLDLSDEEKHAVDALLDGQFGDPLAVAGGMRPPNRPAQATAEAESLFAEHKPKQLKLGKDDPPASARDYFILQRLLPRVTALARDEKFLHWEVAFPGVWRNWQSAEPEGGFDAIIGNPPWDRMKMQEVEWFAARAPAIAMQARAADRKRMVAALQKSGDALARDYDVASARADKSMQRARESGDYPLLSRGDINLYSLFVERAQALLKPNGIAGLLTPSGIASDLTASRFFKQVASAGRVLALFDFENRRGEDAAGNRRSEFFPDIDSRFKFCTFVVGGKARHQAAAECAFFLRDPPAFAPSDKLFRMTASDFALVNPNTGTAPIFRTKRDAELTTAIYKRLPVLVDRSSGKPVAAWPVKYLTMFHMTNDSHLFWTRERLEAEGAYPVELGRWRKGEMEWVPLYVGKAVWHFDHRKSDVIVSENVLHHSADSDAISSEEKRDPSRLFGPQYWTKESEVPWPNPHDWALGFRDITNNTNERTMVAAIVPKSGVGNSLPLATGNDPAVAFKLLSCWTCFAFDYLARMKSQSTHLNWFAVEQLPVIPSAKYAHVFGNAVAESIVRDHVLRLTYTAHDMTPFARDMGYEGPPFVWNEAERRQLRARLDALYFHLYGVTDEADVRYILSTFPIVERKDRAAHEGVYLTAEMIVWHMRALAAGDTASDAPVATLIRNAKAAA